MITQTYKLNMIPDYSVPVVVKTSQYDVDSRTLTFQLYDGSKMFSLNENMTAYIRGKKGDNKVFEYPMVVDKHSVSVDVKEQMTVLAGQVMCEVVLMQDGEILGTANFTLDVERSPIDGGEISKTDLPIIDILMNGGDIGQYLRWTNKGADWEDKDDAVHIDTTAHWNAQRELIAREKNIYVYTDHSVVDGVAIPAVKIGDGLAYLIDLPFVSSDVEKYENIRGLLLEHIDDDVRHITAAERNAWNNKVTCFISQDDPTNLVFTTESEGE